MSELVSAFLAYLGFAVAVGGLVGVGIHLLVASPRLRAVAQSGCLAVLFAPAVLGGHEGGIVPFAFVLLGFIADIRMILANPRMLDLPNTLLSVGSLVATWGILLVPAWLMNRRFSVPPAKTAVRRH